MVGHINYNVLNANEDFVVILTSNLITCFIYFEYEIPFSCLLLGGSAHIYWILDLKVKCTEYGVCGQEAFNNARANLLFEARRDGQQFLVEIKNNHFGFFLVGLSGITTLSPGPNTPPSKSL
jgi:hypothetical protein